jgi:UDP-2,3-diacylglucosamine hydrolase
MAAAKARYFISDLHLSEQEPALCSLFFDFIDVHVPTMQSLDILGDFFDAWIGDDDDSALAAQVAASLWKLSQHCPIRFLHGNRDFLLGSEFAARSGFSLLDEVTTDEGLLLCHGDQLCTDDLGYMQFRAQVRQAAWQHQMLAQSLDTRRAYAANARAQSAQHQKTVDMAIMDVNTHAVNTLMAAHPGHLLVHGHTHRPGVFPEEFGKRIVLGDWRANQPSYLRCEASQFELFAHGRSWLGSLS